MSVPLKPYEERPYRLGVGLMLVNAKNQVFVAQRLDTSDPAWQMPQGGVDEGESVIDAAFRELEEEIGTNKAEFIACLEEWISYDLPSSLIDKVWQGAYRGQKQKWIALRFVGDVSDICVHTEHPEFSHWRWVEACELPSLATFFKRALYETVLEKLWPLVLQAACKNDGE